MYGFHKIAQEDRSISFSHPQFLRGSKELLGGIKRKIAKKETELEMDIDVQEQLQKNIEIFNIRLSQLEQRDKDCDWLRTECQKLQYSSLFRSRQRNQQLEMFCRWIGSFCSYSDAGSTPKPICSRTNETHFNGQQEILSNYYNGLQKLFSSHYAVCNGNNSKKADDFPIYKDRTPSRRKALPLRKPEHEPELIDLPVPNSYSHINPLRPPEPFNSPLQSPHLSPFRFDAAFKGSFVPIQKTTDPTTTKLNKVLGKQELKQEISSDLD
jgi:hypothetical protein